MILLIDAGNTRVKWCQWDGDGFSGAGSAAVNGEWLGGIRKALAPGVTRVVLSNVLGPEFAARLRARLPVPIDPVVASSEAGGVRNGYATPEALGADRWAALLGARARHPDVPVLIVSAGTALVIDLLAADGEHAGGWIAPGLRLAEAALTSGTVGVHIGAVSRNCIGPGASTEQAVRSGTTESALGLIARAMEYGERTERQTPRLVLTGGDAEYLQGAGALNGCLEPELVFHGLARLAARPAARSNRT